MHLPVLNRFECIFHISQNALNTAGFEKCFFVCVCVSWFQRAVIGSQVEQKMVNSLQKNKTLLSFGMSFDTQGPRIRAAELMVRNNDSCKLIIKHPSDP